MSNDSTTTVVAILCKNMRVLACSDADNTDNAVWELPVTFLKVDEDPSDACKRLAKDTLGCLLSTAWLLHTQRCEEDGQSIAMECYVCAPLPDEEPRAQTKALRWLRREDLTQVKWAAKHEELVRMVGTYWDQLFQAEHL